MGQLDDCRKNSAKSRQSRAALKMGLRTGTVSLEAALRPRVEDVGAMPTYELIKALPKIGNARLAILNSWAIIHRINLFLPIVVLTERQRRWLLTACYTVVKEEEHGNRSLDQRATGT